jgi:hypothetical protein
MHEQQVWFLSHWDIIVYVNGNVAWVGSQCDFDSLQFCFGKQSWLCHPSCNNFAFLVDLFMRVLLLFGRLRKLTMLIFIVLIGILMMWISFWQGTYIIYPSACFLSHETDSIESVLMLLPIVWVKITFIYFFFYFSFLCTCIPLVMNFGLCLGSCCPYFRSADNSVHMFDRRNLNLGGVGAPVHKFEGHNAAVLCVQVWKLFCLLAQFLIVSIYLSTNFIYFWLFLTKRLFPVVSR